MKTFTPRATVGAGWKRCGDCKELRPRDEFRRDASRKDGLSVYCKTCTSVGDIPRVYHGERSALPPKPFGVCIVGQCRYPAVACDRDGNPVLCAMHEEEYRPVCRRCGVRLTDIATTRGENLCGNCTDVFRKREMRACDS